jgi:hypothetical protein
MKPCQRLTEAIKQTKLAIKDVDHPETRQTLEQGVDSLEEGLNSLNTDPEN